MGRRKIEIKEIEDLPTKYISFCKRRKGLFKKASELAIRGCSVGFVVFSPAGKVYTFGHPDIYSVAARFLGGPGQINPARGTADDAAAVPEVAGDQQERNDVVAGVDRAEEIKPETAAAGVEAEEKADGGGGETKNSDGGSLMGAGDVKVGSLAKEVLESKRFWWNKSTDGMGLQELQEFQRSLADLRKKVIDRADQLHGSKSFEL